MLLKNKTIEELLDIKEELHNLRDEEKDGSLYLLISVYEELYKQISADKTSEYGLSIEVIMKKLISCLIWHGSPI